MKRTIAAALVLAYGAVGLTGCDDRPARMTEDERYVACVDNGGSWIEDNDAWSHSSSCVMPGCEGDAK